MANWWASHEVKSVLPSQPAALTPNRHRFVAARRVSQRFAVVQLVEHEANDRDGLPGPRLPKHHQPPCLSAARKYSPTSLRTPTFITGSQR